MEVNDTLKDEPGLVNQSPYEKGWMIVIRITNPAELDRLISAAEYQALVSRKVS
jgi:glycine cleavage system H protein